MNEHTRRLRVLLRRLDLLARARHRRTVQHPPGLARPSVDAVVVADKVAGEDDVAIAKRLLAAYEAAVRGAPPQPEPSSSRFDLWSMIETRQARFESILDRGDARELAAYLCNVSRHDASQGLEQGDIGYDRIVGDRSYRGLVALTVKDALVSLAEAVGALAVENPEQGSFGKNIRLDSGELAARVAARLGIDITPPDVDGGLLKIDTGRGLFGGRDVNAIYTAHLVRQTLRELPSPRICEIGGGSGRVAYWTRRMGPATYTIVDLPRINVLQGYYVLKSLPWDEVSLCGEPLAKAASRRLRILPTQAIADLGDGSFDLVLNQDSFPEMSPDTVTDYLRWIRRCCDGSLMSINHESKPAYGDGLRHVSVPEAVDDVGGFELTHRFPYWMRKGYVVELHRIAR